jgi:hypothetical protein
VLRQSGSCACKLDVAHKFWKISVMQHKRHVALFIVHAASSQTHDMLEFAFLVCAADCMLPRDSVSSLLKALYDTDRSMNRLDSIAIETGPE